MAEFPKTDRTSITRLPKRGVYNKEAIHSILDEALYCTLSFVRDNRPFQIPTGFCRIGDDIYIHGSVGSGYLRALAESGGPVCICATLIDGLVLARSAFHHSVNYRSVVAFGRVERVTDEKLLYAALEAFTEKMQRGRWQDVRKPSDSEWKAHHGTRSPHRGSLRKSEDRTSEGRRRGLSVRNMGRRSTFAAATTPTGTGPVVDARD